MASWVDLAPAAQPSTRYDVGMDWDRANGKLVLFGGVGGVLPSIQSDTWLWDGANWTHVIPATSPGAQASRGMIAWDGTRIIYLRTAVPMETWAWSGTNWTQLSPSTVPGLRTDAQMAWTGTYVLMFGGDGGAALDETWTWDGTDWTQLSPSNSPDPSRTGVLASDGAGETIYFGKNGATVFTNDTFRWDAGAEDWVLLSPSTPPPGRQYAAFAYGGSGNGLVLFGGETVGPVKADDTWIWRDGEWCECEPDASPSARTVAAMGYTPDGPILFGEYWAAGPPPTTETWELIGLCCVTPDVITAGISHRFGLG